MPREEHLAKKDSTRQELRAAIHRSLLHLEENHDSAPSAKKLAEIVGMSTSHFHQAFRSVVGETVAKYHQRIRIERAASFSAIPEPSSALLGSLALGLELFRKRHTH